MKQKTASKNSEKPACELCGDKNGNCRFEKACSCWYGVSCNGTGKSLKAVK